MIECSAYCCRCMQRVIGVRSRLAIHEFKRRSSCSYAQEWMLPLNRLKLFAYDYSRPMAPRMIEGPY